MDDWDVWIIVLVLGFLFASLPYFCLFCLKAKWNFLVLLFWFLNTTCLGLLWHCIGFEWRGDRYWGLRSASSQITKETVPWTSTFVIPSFVRLEFPTTEEELKNIVLTSRPPLRIVGSGHSWSPTAYTEGTLVDVRYLNKIIDFDRIKQTIVVQSGMKVQDAVQFLFSNGLCFYGVGSIRAQSIGGIVSQGVHGPHPDGFNRHVIGLRVLLANGTFTEISSARDLYMWRSSMGMLGVIVSIIIQVFPMLHLTLERTPISSFEEFDMMGQYLHVNSSATFTGFLYPSLCGSIGWKRIGRFNYNQIERFNIAEYELKNQTDIGSRLQLHFNDHMHPAMQYITRGFLGTVVSCVEQILADFGHSTLLSGPSHDVLPNDGLIPQFYEIIDYEYMIPLRNCRAFATELMKDQKFGRILIPVCLRLLRAEDSCLSIAEEDSCVFAVQTMRGMAYTIDVIAIEKRVGEMGGRAHFGKVAPGNFRFYSYSCLHNFQTLRRKLDPSNKFLAPFLAKLIREKSNADYKHHSQSEEVEEFKPTLLARQYSMHRDAMFFFVGWLVSLIFFVGSYKTLSIDELGLHRTGGKHHCFYSRVALYSDCDDE